MKRLVLALFTLAPVVLAAQEGHDHAVPEKLGTVSFPTSCRPAVQADFNRAVALLHSFAYKAADQAFQAVAGRDPKCAMAHWGSAMTHFHQLWDLPPSPTDSAAGRKEISEAQKLADGSARERGFINAAAQIFSDDASTPYPARASKYEAAMHELAAANPHDVETQVFYSLGLISNASPADRQHTKQKHAVTILEPLFHDLPDHPGAPHYLIHACDSQELAPKGLVAARAYAGIAPSAPHALHMPSHIFTRLGLWDDSIQSNMAARRAALDEGDVGEELHAMDYLVYAYLQRERDAEAAELVAQVKSMQALRMGEFKVSYAATAMPVRFLVERKSWKEAAAVSDPPATAPGQVVAITTWARGLGYAHTGRAAEAEKESQTLGTIEERLRTAGNVYWAGQVGIMKREVAAWSREASHQGSEAVALLRSAADDEDGIEKLPLTPGPIVPAREQLAQLLVVQGDTAGAAKEFQTAALSSPGRRGVREGQAALQSAH